MLNVCKIPFHQLIIFSYYSLMRSEESLQMPRNIKEGQLVSTSFYLKPNYALLLYAFCFFSYMPGDSPRHTTLASLYTHSYISLLFYAPCLVDDCQGPPI